MYSMNMNMVLRVACSISSTAKQVNIGTHFSKHSTGIINQFSRCLSAAAEPAAAASLKRTALHEYHLENGAKMVPFAGYDMPIQYKDSIVDSSIHCRQSASVFDVSHMCGITLKGKDVLKFMHQIVVTDIAALQAGTGSLSVLTNAKGGIIDDTVVTKVSEEEIYMVVNAGCRDKDLKHINEQLDLFKSTGGDVSFHVHDERCMFAFQGPKAVGILQPLMSSGEDLSKLYFGMMKKTDVNGIPCFVTRTGYTGEDGFEISVPNERALDLITSLVDGDTVKLAGLGARDSLRLEAGLCLYGNDLNEDITPLEAGLTWTISKSRRDLCDFVGGEFIKEQLASGVSKRRVGFISSGAPAREHCDITLEDGTVVGEITSGGFSPNLKKNISMGYVLKEHAKKGTQLKVVVRKKVNDCVVTPMPFVPAKYHRPS